MKLITKCVQTIIITLLPMAVAMANAAAPSSPQTVSLTTADLQRFAAAVSQIRNYYVEQVGDDKLFNHAIRGMVEGLDPHSSYLDEDDYKALKDETNGEFTGLGLEVTPDNGYLKVVSPIDDTPAQKLGIKPGDIIIRLDSMPLKGMDIHDAIAKMRGKPGTKISLTVVRKDSDKPIKFTLVREVIHVQSVKSRLLAKNYGYIRISTFQANTPVDLAKAIKQLRAKADGNIKGLILDLRNNPGGLLDAAIDTSNDFLDSDNLNYDHLIVYTKGRLTSAQLIAKATGDDLIQGAPIVVLINSGSASAAEIVAGALQDHKRAVIMGSNSFGKGSVQTILPLDGKTAIKLTTALYYTPAGRSIQAKGIQPDILIDDNGQQMPNPTTANADYLKEADLQNHLQSSDSLSSGDDGDMPKETDYQILQALNLLKGLAVMHNHPELSN